MGGWDNRACSFLLPPAPRARQCSTAFLRLEQHRSVSALRVVALLHALARLSTFIPTPHTTHLHTCVRATSPLRRYSNCNCGPCGRAYACAPLDPLTLSHPPAQRIELHHTHRKKGTQKQHDKSAHININNTNSLNSIR
eukprot:scaffold1044_cov120-Isochrysis_galbana.AAC.34